MLYRRLPRPLVRAATAAVLLLVPLAPAALANPQAGFTHVVQPGETLWAIASAAGVDANALAALNDLSDSDAITVGQSLALPASAAATSAPAAVAAATAAVVVTPPAVVAKGSVLTAYTVQAGETLGAVARDFGITTDALVSANGLGDADHVSAGAVLKVPQPARAHVVQDGESLKDVAAQEKVDLGSLVDFNGLPDPDLVRAGQVVLVPVQGQVVAASIGQPRTPAAPAATPTPAPTSSPTPAPTSAATATTATPTPTASPTTAAVPAKATPTASAKPAARPTPAAPAVSGDGLAGIAAKLVGAPYVWGGTSPAGFDCSGLVFYVARQAGKPTPRGLLGEFNNGSHPGRDDLKAGDLVFFQNTYTAGLSHAGVYLGNGTFISAADEASGVVVSDLASGYWSGHWFGATRL